MAAVLVHHSSQGVWHIELNNPPCNTLTTEMIVQLDTLLKKAQNDPSCIGVVLSSAVEDYFCVGDDPLELGIMQHMSTPGTFFFSASCNLSPMLRIAQHVVST